MNTTQNRPEPFTITNDKGRPFLVRVVFPGDLYGLNDCLTHNGPGVMVEFYDHSPEIVETFCKAGQGDRGQFVSRYNIETLCKDAASLYERGLNLQGSVPGWAVDGDALRPVLNMCRNLTRREPQPDSVEEDADGYRSGDIGDC
jgi:hypothetical protein